VIYKIPLNRTQKTKMKVKGMIDFWQLSPSLFYRTEVSLRRKVHLRKSDLMLVKEP
jgi:hypothetical protein